MRREVKGDGPLSAALVLIGEAPGKEENACGKPFVGRSGFKLWSWVKSVGLARQDCYVDNVYPFQPPENKLHAAPKSDVEAWATNLHERLAHLTSPKVIVPMGNYALRALLHKPLWGKDAPSINNWRGSLLRYAHPRGEVSMIPTLHPAATLSRATLQQLCLLDWAKIAAEVRRPSKGRPPTRQHNIAPSRVQVRAFEHAVQVAWEIDPKKNSLAIDIETNPKLGEIICVGFALSPGESWVLQWRKWPKAIRRLCEHPIAKVLQNGFYDCYWLARVGGIHVRGYKWDTLAMHHCIAPSLPHDLATQASLYTKEPYWKTSAKDEDTIKVMRTPLRALLRYNGIDACVTHELAEGYRAYLKKEKRWNR